MHAFFLITDLIGSSLDLNTLVPVDFSFKIFYEVKSIEDARNLKRKLLFSMKDNVLVVIEGVDKAKPEAQNALLKLLEEPPSQNITFLLLVSHEDTLMPTTLSRLTKIHSSKIKIEAKNETDINFSIISKITDRDKAIAVLTDIHSEAALECILALKKNGAVALHLTNFLLKSLPLASL